MLIRFAGVFPKRGGIGRPIVHRQSSSVHSPRRPTKRLGWILKPSSSSSSSSPIASLLQAAYQERQMTVVDAGPEGGERLLLQALQQLQQLQQQQAQRQPSPPPPLHILLRVGYRTVSTSPVDDTAGGTDAAQGPSMGMAHHFSDDCVVAEEDTTGTATTTTTTNTSTTTTATSNKNHNNTSGNDGAKTHDATPRQSKVIHNIGPEYLQYYLSASPLLQWVQEQNEQQQQQQESSSPADAIGPIRVSIVLQNPEVQQQQQQQHSSNNNPQWLSDQLATSLEYLQAHHHQHHPVIHGVGIMSHGLCLPPNHPLHYSWEQHIRPAIYQSHAIPSFIQFPVNLLETTGLRVAQQIRRDRTQITNDMATRNQNLTITPSSSSSSSLLQIYAMRPFTCYPDGGTGRGYPFVLADTFLESEQQWTNHATLQTRPPTIYSKALLQAMAHFDADEIVQKKLQGIELTTEERETIDGCRLLQSLFHDVDAGLGQVRSYAAHQDMLFRKIIPLIYDTFEGYDEETATVLQDFFTAYSVAVQWAIARNVRALITDPQSVPCYTDLRPEQRLQEYALKFLWDQKDDLFDMVMVGTSNPAHIHDLADIWDHWYESRQESG